MRLIKFPLIITLLFTMGAFVGKAQQSSTVKINFTKFDVVEHNNKIAINLITDGSVPTNYFEIQKSVDGVNFKTIALILGPDPKQSTCDCYGCFDKEIKGKGNFYYRARHVGIDGSEQLTESRLLAKS